MKFQKEIKNNRPEFGGCKLMKDVVQLGRWKHPTNTSLCPSLFFVLTGFQNLGFVGLRLCRWPKSQRNVEEQLIKGPEKLLRRNNIIRQRLYKLGPKRWS